MSEALHQRWTIGSDHNQVWGPDLVSGPTVGITHRYHVVSGAGAIANMTLPYPTFSGEITLLFLGAATTVLTGNIGVAITAVPNQGVNLVYNPALAKWYPVKF
jgi:hypothetical protein